MWRAFVAGFLLMCCCPAISAGSGIEVEAWARATPPGGSSGAIYGVFTDTSGKARRAERIIFEKATHIMVHRTVLEDDVMKMKHASLLVPSNGNVELLPGGLHIMLVGLKSPLIEGCRYPFSILWRDGSETSHTFVTGTYGQSVPPEEEGRLCP